MEYVLDASKVDSLWRNQSLTISFFLLGVNWRASCRAPTSCQFPNLVDLWGISRLHRFFAYLSVLATWSSADTVAQNGYQVF